MADELLMVSRYSAYRSGSDTVSPEVIDRILLGACAAVWLVLIGVSVAASVALTDLGQGFHKVARTSQTPWGLYTVIAVSALIIAGAIPVLLRARRLGGAEPTARPAGTSAAGAARRPARAGQPGARATVERTRLDRSAADPSGAAADRVWLRGTVALTAAFGAALTAVAAGTYLMAVGHDGACWAAYAVAGLITVGMPAIEFLHVRQLRRVVAEL